MYIGEIIKKYREENHLSLRDFADRSNLSYSYIQKLEKIYNIRTGKPIAITVDATQEVAKAMNMKIDDLLPLLNLDQQVTINYIDKEIYKPTHIPVLGRIPAGIPIEMVEDIIDFEDISPRMLVGDKKYFALKIKGDSMENDYHDGDVIICLKQEDCTNGDDCVVSVNGDDATFKRVFKDTDEKGITLQPLNTSKYEPIHYTNKQILEKPIKILGIVVEIRRTVKKNK